MFLQEFPSKALRSDALLLLVSAVLGPYVGAFGNAEGGGGVRVQILHIAICSPC